MQGHEMIPRQAAVEAVNGSLCYTTTPALASIASLNTFCGGGKGVGPCNGDSGDFKRKLLRFFVKLITF